MSERGSLRSKIALLALAAAVAGGGAAALLLAPLGGSGGDAGVDVVAVAFRTDGGSPALSVAVGNTNDVELSLPAGEYEVELAYGDVIFDMGRQAGGHSMRFGKVTDTTSDHRFTQPDVAAALRVVAGFASDAEAVRLDLLSSASAGFTQPLFSGEPGAGDFARFYADYRALGDEEDGLTAALELLEGRLVSAEPPRYVRVDAAPSVGLLDRLLDSTLPDFFNRVRKLPERERVRVIEIVAQMDGTEKQEAFDGLPPSLRGTASSYEEWVQSLKRGDLDEQLGAIHGYLYAVATGATQAAGHTPGQSMAEEGGPLVQSGIDLEVKAYGKVPNVGKMIDVTQKALEWEAYARKLYADPNAGAAAVLNGPYRTFVKDHIKKDLRSAMPDAPDKVIDALASQLSQRVVATLASGLATPVAGAGVRGGESPGYPPLSAPDAPEPTPTVDPTEAWIESVVDTVAQRLLASGESGIDVAVATDDLRVCLRQTQEAGLSRQDSLETCAMVMEGGDGPSPTASEPPAQEPPQDVPTVAVAPTVPPAPTLPPATVPVPPPPAPSPTPCESYDPMCGLFAH